MALKHLEQTTQLIQVDGVNRYEVPLLRDNSGTRFKAGVESGQNLNKHLLAGPNLGSSLLGVILRFRQHEVAISGDIKAMFHQVRVKPGDQSLFRFIWRNCDETQSPTIYQWLSLLFGSTCSPCCVTYPLQKLAIENSEQYPEVRRSVMEAFYVDNCLDSVKTAVEAKTLIHAIRRLLNTAGFNIRQWASNKREALVGLPEEALSENSILEFKQDVTEAEPMLGMRWDTGSDLLTYQQNHDHQEAITMRYIYRTLARQYDPIGFLVPFLVRGKLIDATYQLHVFCDSSKKAYGAVSYLRGERDGKVETAFVIAKSKVAPRKQLSMPRLELCAALIGAKLIDFLVNTLTIPVSGKHLWSDSTTVLTWITSETCRFSLELELQRFCT
ncbi:uncharacterized protein LOC117120392 [Anneissia japonica]|uniref:uncharacterized protein LOC117120392 n=1 Tax=Anneissia japonica TaxID=1529436 RepID=UPI00142579D6|nr:uncharacterized protein LOC117120392 [Anneissia japonica]